VIREVTFSEANDGSPRSLPLAKSTVGTKIEHQSCSNFVLIRNSLLGAAIMTASFSIGVPHPK
jgi:hypothetical protein